MKIAHFAPKYGIFMHINFRYEKASFIYKTYLKNEAKILRATAFAITKSDNYKGSKSEKFNIDFISQFVVYVHCTISFAEQNGVERVILDPLVAPAYSP